MKNYIFLFLLCSCSFTVQKPFNWNNFNRNDFYMGYAIGSQSSCMNVVVEDVIKDKIKAEELDKYFNNCEKRYWDILKREKVQINY